MELTPRDTEILQALTRHVRILTLPQIARTFWHSAAEPLRAARNRIHVLAAADMVQIQHAPAHPELTFEIPQFSWEPGQPAPDTGSIAYRLQTRWSAHPIATVCIAATQSAANRFHGHGGRFSRAIERSHDINLSRVYLIYRRRGLIIGWIFEEEMRGRERKDAAFLPDVVIEANGKRKVVEFGGAYPKAKLERFHQHCKAQSLSYEVW